MVSLKNVAASRTMSIEWVFCFKYSSYNWYYLFLSQTQFVLIIFFVLVIAPLTGCTMVMSSYLIDIIFAPLFLVLFYRFYKSSFNHTAQKIEWIQDNFLNQRVKVSENKHELLMSPTSRCYDKKSVCNISVCFKDTLLKVSGMKTLFSKIVKYFFFQLLEIGFFN